jgi:hypothetical protein
MLSDITGGSTYTDAQARAALSLTTTGTSGAATYNPSTGVFNIPQYAAGTVGTITWLGTAYNINSSNNITLATPTTSDISEGSNLYYTNTRARAAITLTTTGTSGTATYDNTTGTLNIPNYATGGGSGWALGGNALTNSGTQYLGTTNSTSIRIRTNGTQRMVIDSLGFVGIGTTPHTTRILNVAGSVNATGDANTVAYWVANGNAIRGGTSGGTIYLDASPDLSGTINIRASTTSIGALSVANVTSTADATFGTAAAGTGYKVGGNYTMQINSGGNILRFNDNSVLTKVGMRGQNYQINDNSTPSFFTYNASAILELNSTTRYFLGVRMTTTQRDAMTGLIEGAEIYNLTTHTKQYYNGTTWVSY